MSLDPSFSYYFVAALEIVPALGGIRAILLDERLNCEVRLATIRGVPLGLSLDAPGFVSGCPWVPHCPPANGSHTFVYVHLA